MENETMINEYMKGNLKYGNMRKKAKKKKKNPLVFMIA